MTRPFDPKTGDGRVFVLSASRTGTMSLHVFLVKHGYDSVHFFMTEARQDAANSAEENLARFSSFIDASPLQAFSDYPTRLFHRWLHEAQPAAKFILTRRVSTDIWGTSMRNLRAFHGKTTDDIPKLCANYERINAEIHALYSGTRDFLSFVIDDGGDHSAELSEFLGVQHTVTLERNHSYAEMVRHAKAVPV